MDLLFSQCQSYKKLLGEQANQDKINFFDSINKTYGEPAFELKTEKGIIDNSSIIGKKGIISFHVSGWGDATGHISLWNGKKVLYTGNRNYFKANGKQ